MDDKKFKNNINPEGNSIIKSVKKVKRELLILRKMDKIIEMMKDTLNCVIMESKVVDYNLIKELWSNFICSKCNFKQFNYRKSDIVDLAVKEQDNSNFLQDLLSDHIDSFDDNLIMIYKKGCDTILYLLKSESILYEDEYMPPYFLHTFNYDFVNLDETLYDNELAIYYS